MKINKILLSFALAALCCACSDDDDKLLTLDEVSRSVTVAPVVGATAQVSFTCNGTWFAYTDVDWFTFDPIEGKSGGTSFTVTVTKANPDLAERSANIWVVADDGNTETVTVTQQERYEADLLTDSFSLNAFGGNITVAMKANVPFTVDIPADCDWITPGSSTKALSESSVSFNVAENRSGVTRVMELTARAEGIDEPYTIEVSQSASLWSMSLADAGLSAAADAYQSVAVFGDNVILSQGDGSDPVVLDLRSGEKKGTLGVADLKVCQVSTDDAGHLVLSNYRTFDGSAYSGAFKVWYMDSITDTPKEIISTESYGIYGEKVDVRGDVTKDAMIVAPRVGGEVFGGENNLMVWTIRGGVAEESVVSVSGLKGLGWLAGYWFGTHGQTACVGALGTDMSTGVVVSYYDADFIEYISAAGDAGNATAVFAPESSGSSWMWGYNAIDFCEVGGHKYMAMTTATFFSYGTEPVYVLDVTDFSAVAAAGTPAIDDNDFLVATPATTDYGCPATAVVSDVDIAPFSSDSAVAVRVSNNNNAVEAFYLAL